VCGFIGAVSLNIFNQEQLLKSNNNIICRGPDETKTLFSNTNDIFENKSNLNLSLIFNRLSIIDLSDKASQPMISKDFQTLLLFNGEIYNNLDLRKSLKNKGIKFDSHHSDTETLLLGLSYEGIDFLEKVEGQFSIFFFDNKIKKGYLIKDRHGQKPLYYFADKENILFSSNFLSLSSLINKKEIDQNAVEKYLQIGVIPSPETIFKNIKKVIPGHVVEINFMDKFDNLIDFQYWNIEDFVDEQEFSNEKFFDLFSKAVSKRTISDVPVATFLSGGKDSTAIIKSLVDSNFKVNSFSVGFDDKVYDESNWFNQVVDKYNLNQSTRILNLNDINEEVENAIDAFDELYSDPSLVPSYIITKAMAKNYKVALSGDGGDELLGGYKRVLESLKFSQSGNSIIPKLNNVYPNFLGTGNTFLKRSKEIKTSYSSYLEDNNFLEMLNIPTQKHQTVRSFFGTSSNIYKNIQIAEYRLFLAEMMMFKVDRTSMANSLEVRSPFVDHKLVEYILSSNTPYIRNSNDKLLLNNYLENDFNSDFINRKKMGFVFSIESWIFSNLSEIKTYLEKSDFIKDSNKYILQTLSLNKSRINALRIWRLYLLEKYLDKL
jgi:asparagine synthase (glutamine-hydrolysing)